MNLFLLLFVLGLTFFASALILSKYIDFAIFMIKRKDEVVQPRVIKFSHPKEFRTPKCENKKNDIIIDIPVHEVQILKRK
jgi:hypothetical protein